MTNWLSIPTALGAATWSIRDLRRAFPNWVLNSVFSGVKLGRASTPLGESRLPLTAVPRAWNTHILFPAPKVSVQTGFPCTQYMAYPLGWLVLPRWMDILKTQIFTFLGVISITNRMRRWGGADVGWREGQHDYKESKQERAIWCLQSQRGGVPHLLFGSMCCDERQQDSGRRQESYFQFSEMSYCTVWHFRCTWEGLTCRLSL